MEWGGKFYRKDNSRGVLWNGVGSFTEKITVGVFCGMGWEVFIIDHDSQGCFRRLFQGVVQVRNTVHDNRLARRSKDYQLLANRIVSTL